MRSMGNSTRTSGNSLRSMGNSTRTPGNSLRSMGNCMRTPGNSTQWARADKGTTVRHRTFEAGRFFPARARGQARLVALTPCVPLSREAGEGDMECGSGASAFR